MTKQEIIKFILDNHKQMTCPEMARALNTTAPRIYYHLMNLGLLNDVKKHYRAKKESSGKFFDVDAVGFEGTWLI